MYDNAPVHDEIAFSNTDMNFTSAARQNFYTILHQPESSINLAEAALYIAQEEYPDLDVEEYLNALNTMAMEVQERLGSETYPLRIIHKINQYLYEDLDFQGENYDDPRNSFLNDVIERRRGIPLTLSIVYLEIAKRIEFPMVGIGMPGHFLIQPDQNAMEIFVDPFQRGEILFAEDCQQKLNAIYGKSMPFRAEFLAPVGPLQILARMLTNLKHIYLKQRDLDKTLAAIDRILLVFPEASRELRDRGFLYHQMERWSEAKRDLELYLTKNPRLEDIMLVRRLLEQIPP
jgi:regulator of sirC expression with transglutaminase-like and TPR domain